MLKLKCLSRAQRIWNCDEAWLDPITSVSGLPIAPVRRANVMWVGTIPTIGIYSPKASGSASRRGKPSGSNLIATSGESFRCAQDARERRADELRKQQAEQQRLADRQTELDRQRHEQQKQQDASQQLAAQQQQQRLQLDADAEQQAQMARHREAQAQFARESAQNAELARLAQQQQRAQLEQNKARRLEQQRQQNINMQNFGESIRTAENQRRYSENEQLIAERLAETTPEIRLTPKAQGLVNVASLGAGSIDPNHAGSVLVDAGRGCHLRYNKDTRSRPEMNADEVRWDGPCEQGYANGDGELTWTQAGKKNSARLRMVLGAAIPN